MNTNEIAKTVRSMPMTEALYAMKDAGKTPIATVTVERGKVQQVRLSIDGVDYYFHATKDKDGNALLVKTETHGEFSTAAVPFDGWGVSVPEPMQA